MDLAEIARLLDGIPEDDTAVLDDLISSAPVWVPNPGPQTDAYFSAADELLYGGTAGSGKSDLLLGLALNEHKSSLILRRTNKEVSGLVERVTGILGTRNGFNGQTGLWRHGDSVMELGGCQLEEDKQKYKGRARDLFCVGPDTEVLMGDGTYKKIKYVVPGDEVDTLEGPRKVNKTFTIQGKDCTRLVVRGVEDTVEQIQSTNHEVLLRTGWVSRDTINGGLPYSGEGDAMLCRVDGAVSRGIYCTLWLVSLVLLCPFLFARNIATLLTAAACLRHSQCPVDSISNKASRVQGKDYEGSDGGLPTPLTLGSRFHAWLISASKPFRSGILCVWHSLRRYVNGNDCKPIEPVNSPDGYQACLRLCDGRIPFLSEYLYGVVVSLLYPHLSSDAERQNPRHWLAGVLAHIRKYSYRPREYRHPYNSDKRSISGLLVPCSFSYHPTENIDLFDLEIEEVNHFITRGGIVNKNCFDELVDFTESQYTFLITWNRSALPGQRCRVVGATNPPTTPEGTWVVRRWAAWLDPKHPNPAQPGELRWYTTDVNGNEIEVDGPGPHYIGSQTEPVLARSRTFIPAKLADNPYLRDTNYKASLDALPPELRAAYRDGDFGTSLKDDPYQIIPIDWVTQAQARWQSTPPPGVPMCSIGVDVAVAKDKFVMAPRHDYWYSKLCVIPGNEVSDAKQAAGRVVAIRRDNAAVVVDVGGGWGADCYAQLVANGVDAYSYMGVKSSNRKSACNQFHFSNIRTEALWRFREALDPSQPGGSQIQLPPSVTLKADLCTPTYTVKKHQYGMLLEAESKEKVCDRLGRSTDEGDAVIMSWFHGLKQSEVAGGWEDYKRRSAPTVNTGKKRR